MPTARIFQYPKNAMQSGRAGTHRWALEFEPAEAKQPDPLTGWAGSGDTRDQVRLGFPSAEAAIAYAEREGLAFTVIAAPERKLKLQSYADNFSVTPKAVVRRWIVAFNARNVDMITALYRADATNHQVALDPVVGRDAIRDMFEREFAAAEMECIPENLFEDGEWAILEWRDPKGLRGCGFFHVIDGHIGFQRGYWDRLSFEALHGDQPRID